MDKKLLILALLMTSCTESVNKTSYDTVSLLDYTNETELLDKGFTPEAIEAMNNLSLNEKWGAGHSYFKGYHRYRVNDFDILTNPNRPDDIYIIKDGNYITKIMDSHTIIIYQEGTEFPNRNDTSVIWNTTNESKIYVANDKQLYIDWGLDGPDIVYDKMWLTGDKSYISVSDMVEIVPQRVIREVYVPNKQCLALAFDVACCQEGGNYKPYRFDNQHGWQVFQGPKDITNVCNSDNFEQQRNEMRYKETKDYVINNFDEALSTK